MLTLLLVLDLFGFALEFLMQGIVVKGRRRPQMRKVRADAPLPLPPDPGPDDR